MIERRRRTFKHARHSRRRRQWQWVWWAIPSALIAVFVLINAIAWLAYRDRTYPGTRVLSIPVGNVGYAQLPEQLKRLKPLPEQLELTHGNQSERVSAQALGISLDVSRTIQSADKQRSKLPILNFWRHPQLAAPISISQETLAQKAQGLAKVFTAPPTAGHLVLTGEDVQIAAPVPGYNLAQNQLSKVLTQALDKGQQRIAVPVDVVAAPNSASLQNAKQALERQLATNITYHYNNLAKHTSKSDMIAWLSPSGNSYVPAIDKIISYLSSVGHDLGIIIKDQLQLAGNTMTAFEQVKPLDATVSAQAVQKSFTYCTAVKGVSESELPHLAEMLSATYADARGWNLEGRVSFKKAGSSCDYTVWLSAASQMPSFGGLCDSSWSCRSGNNVVINYDRWTGASAAWNQHGGSLDDYQHMVINHETGHWLGFDHDHCSGAGQQAPVMQQQSIDLQGCVFNPWPKATERAELKQRLQLP